MAYGNYNNISKGFLFRFKLKLCKWLAASFPLNSIRVVALRLIGFNIGEQVYIGPSFLLTTINTDDQCYLEIQDRVAIGPRVTIVLASDANWSKLNMLIKPIRGNVILENDCWLGAGCIILPNVTIGKCAIVAAGAVVSKNVLPYTIVGGVPAKTIKIINTL